ncbi:alpha-methylacyl-CoA racemase-like [Rhinolophus ferrumequinum]|uniref:alpha-methylacyl-CoA racemase-like n=1 Tax=Rhinolophus ferrumequinum TaxID=59479 RepID=UPI00140FAC9E|nr:alpha-methylacyl-CoA racemase-like [Rhinolophus ferrumequinum]
MALSTVRVVELDGRYPSSFCSMILADFGAQVTRVVWDREYFPNFVNRGKKSLALNLRTPEGAAVLEQICLQSDVLIDPTPEGALGRGKILPEDMLQKNPRLIYVKVSAGVDLSSKNSQSKGHDINFLALSGVLSKFGRKDEIPQAPPNGQGSTIGGGVLGALGIVMALFERAQSGKGQTVNVNLIEGTAYASSVLWYLQNMDYYNKARGENLHDGGSPFYQTYQTSDGKFMAVGAYEPHIYEKFLKGLSLNPSELPKQMSSPDWPRLKTLFADIFSKKTQAQWCEIFADLDACVTPVLTFDDISQLVKKKGSTSFIMDQQDVVAPMPVPFLSKTPASVPSTRIAVLGEHSEEILTKYGFRKEKIAQRLDLGVIKSSKAKANL